MFTDLLRQSDTPVQDDPFIIGDGEDNTPSYIRDQTPIKVKVLQTLFLKV